MNHPHNDVNDMYKPAHQIVLGDKLKLERGKKYRFIGQEEELVYIGYNWSGNGHWHQLTLDGKVWSEIQEQQFDLIEAVD